MQSTLYDHYLTAKVQHPGKYARDLATLLNVSEADLTAARVGHDARRLTSDVRGLLSALEQAGEVKAITRNEYAVHEHLGSYTHQHLDGHAGLILNPGGIDLRLFLSQWKSAFAVSEQDRHSLQFFDAQGDAIHKVYATPATDMTVWQQIVTQYAGDDQAPLVTEPATATSYATTVDAAAIEQEWRAMTDIHQFFPLLRRHNLSRQQAFACVSSDLAFQVDNTALASLLQQTQTDGNAIMIFVSNRGCVQIFTGAVERVAPLKGWLNIFNPRFTLHLRDDTIADSWVTRKPTQDGFVTSLELFAADGTQIAQLFGQRSEGQPEQARWREQINALPKKA